MISEIRMNHFHRLQNSIGTLQIFIVQLQIFKTLMLSRNMWMIDVQDNAAVQSLSKKRFTTNMPGSSSPAARQGKQ